MNLKKYTKLLLILGLFAVVPARGMSYVNYVKSFFVKETDVQKAQRELAQAQKDGKAFIDAIKKEEFKKAEKIFQGSCDRGKVHCLQAVTDYTPAKTCEVPFGIIPLMDMLFDDCVIQHYLKNNDNEVIAFFNKLLKDEQLVFPIAEGIFKNSSKTVQLSAIREIMASYKKINKSDCSKAFINDLITFIFQNDLARDNEVALEFFAKTIEVQAYDTAFIIFKKSPLNLRSEYIKIIVNHASNNVTEPIKLLLIKICLLDASCGKLLESSGFGVLFNRACPTYKHLSRNLAKAEVAFEKFQADPDLYPIYQTVLAKEQELGANYYTFVHGQRSQYYFPEKLYTLLWQLRKKRTVNDFFFPHVTDLITAQDVALEKVQKSFLLNNYKYDADNRKMLLFMNYALFANAENSGSNSAIYVAKNFNAAKGTFNLPVNEPFKKLGYEHIYNKFKDELEELGQQYDKKCPYGNLLFIAIPKDKIHKYAYLAVTGGKRVAMHIEGIGNTTDIRVIMDTLSNNPKKIITTPDPLMAEYVDNPEKNNTDILEFCLVMTQTKGGLDPDTGIKIMPILSGSPEKIAELQKKEDALFAKIKAAIEEEENTKAKAVNRANTIVNHIVLPGKDAQAIAPAKTMARINNIMGHIQPQG